MSLVDLIARSHPGPRVRVPKGCREVSLTCPVEGTILGYYPMIGPNAFFAAIFLICMIWHLGTGIKYKTWSYTFSLAMGCFGEALGYAGRILMWKNPYHKAGFKVQIVMLIISPAFISAGVYLTLKHVVLNFGDRWSRLRPTWYTWIFISGDVLSLILQGAGGGLAATAEMGTKLQDAGTNLMIAGVIWQVVCLAFFGYFLAEYLIRTQRHRDELSPSAMSIISSGKFKLFIGAVIIAFLTIFTRCVYRIPELTGGWGSELMRDEKDFIILEGAMIVIAVLFLSIFHPGYCFPEFCDAAQKKPIGKNFEADSSSTEMMPPHV